MLFLRVAGGEIWISSTGMQVPSNSNFISPTTLGSNQVVHKASTHKECGVSREPAGLFILLRPSFWAYWGQGVLIAKRDLTAITYSILIYLAELEEAQDDAVQDETPENCPRTTATIKMLLRDLDTVKRVATLPWIIIINVSFS